jgi:hypothetical protein
MDHSTVRTHDVLGPVVVTDLPCLEGTAFVLSGSKDTTTRILETEQGLHFFFSEHNEDTLVPVGGSGPTYVESGNQDHRTFFAGSVNGVITFSHVNNDKFVPYLGGSRAGAMVRIHEHETFIGVDTDGDGIPDQIKLDADRSRITCP